VLFVPVFVVLVQRFVARAAALVRRP
jgi:hypothetical protein